MSCLGVMASLTACSGNTGIQALDRPAASEDSLPSDIDLSDPINTESSRFLVTHERVRYYVATTNDSADGCIIAVPSETGPDWFAGCGLLGAADVIVTASRNSGHTAATLVRDDADTRALEAEGWIRIHDNVLVPSS